MSDIPAAIWLEASAQMVQEALVSMDDEHQESPGQILGDEDNGCRHRCLGNPDIALPAGLASPFGAVFNDPCRFVAAPGVTLTDQRRVGLGSPQCSLLQTGPDAYRLVGTKV
jgi:hypothetical protein